MTEQHEKYYDKRGRILVQNLKNRHFDAYYCKDKASALEKALELIPEGATVGWGGSVSCHNDQQDHSQHSRQESIEHILIIFHRLTSPTGCGCGYVRTGDIGNGRILGKTLHTLGGAVILYLSENSAIAYVTGADVTTAATGWGG